MKEIVGAKLHSQANDQPPIASEVINVSKRLDYTNETVRKLADRFSEHFEEQFRNLATIGVTTLVTAISIIIAGMAFLGNAMIRDHVKAAHDKEVGESKQKLQSMIDIAHPELSAAIYTSLSSFFTDLYASLDPNKYDYLYKPYVSAAVHLAQKGYFKAKKMHDLITKDQARQTNEKKETTFNDVQRSIINMSLNNYGYFLADMTTLKKDDKITLTEEAKNAKNLLRGLLPQLELALERKIATQHKLDDYDRGEIFRLRETILWVKLHLGKNFYSDFFVTLNDTDQSSLY